MRWMRHLIVELKTDDALSFMWTMIDYILQFVSRVNCEGNNRIDKHIRD